MFLVKFFLWIFLLEIEKPSVEISMENKNGVYPQKCGRLEALRKMKGWHHTF